MRWTFVAAFTLICWSGYAVCNAADRHWQTGTWGDVGLKRDPRVQGRAVGRSPLGTSPTAPTRSVTPDVGTYVIETTEMRLELEDILPISDTRAFDATVKSGDSVTFALEKNTVYVRNADATEHRLRVTKKMLRNKVR